MQELNSGRKARKTVRTISPDRGLRKKPERGQGTERRSRRTGLPDDEGGTCNRRHAPEPAVYRREPSG